MKNPKGRIGAFYVVTVHGKKNNIRTHTPFNALCYYCRKPCFLYGHMTVPCCDKKKCIKREERRYKKMRNELKDINREINKMRKKQIANEQR